jgi:hypothetical protein
VVDGCTSVCGLLRDAVTKGNKMSDEAVKQNKQYLTMPESFYEEILRRFGLGSAGDVEEYWRGVTGQPKPKEKAS